MKLHHLLTLIFILLTFPLFFYKLGQSSLVSWDEAWYAEVARNITKTGDPINMTWNSKPFFDHPPTGYLLMAITYKIFGVSEFWTRFPSALSAIASLILVYLLGRKLFNPLVGLSAAITLSSATWFIFRARSGNLDIILTMFFLLTLLLAIEAAKKKEYLLPLSIGLSLLFLTKTMVPLSIVPPLIVIFFKNKLYKIKDLIFPVILFLIIGGGWFAIQMYKHPGFIQNFLDVGLRGATLQSDYLANIKLAKDYLYNGIGRWFWPTVLALTLSIFLRQKRFYILVIFFISFILPILFSPKIQIWHLIPLYPILILSFFGFSFAFLEKYFKNFKYHFFTLLLFLSFLIYINQIKMIWHQFINIPAFISDEEILSREAAKYPYRLVVDGEYRPAALFYSEKGTISQAPKAPEDFVGFLNSNDEFLLITNKWRLEDLNISQKDYSIIKQDRDKVLIIHKN